MKVLRRKRIVLKLLASLLLAGVIMSIAAFLVTANYLSQYNGNPKWHAYSKGEYVTDQLRISSRAAVIYCNYNTTVVYLVPSSSLEILNASNVNSIAVSPVPGNVLSGSGWQDSLSGTGSMFTNLSGLYYFVAFANYQPNFGYGLLISEQLSYYFFLLLFGGIFLAISAGISLFVYLVITDTVRF